MNSQSDADDLREEYDFTAEQLRSGVRGKYADRYAEGVNLVRLGQDESTPFTLHSSPFIVVPLQARIAGSSR
jgi:hypothetical protein